MVGLRFLWGEGVGVLRDVVGGEGKAGYKKGGCDEGRFNARCS